MSKGKKQLLTVIGLLLLLAAMVCAYVFVPKGESDTSDEDGTKDTAANTVEVINIEKDNVSEISITLGAITDGKKRQNISDELKPHRNTAECGRHRAFGFRYNRKSVCGKKQTRIYGKRFARTENAAALDNGLL